MSRMAARSPVKSVAYISFLICIRTVRTVRSVQHCSPPDVNRARLTQLSWPDPAPLLEHCQLVARHRHPLPHAAIGRQASTIVPPHSQLH